MIKFSYKTSLFMRSFFGISLLIFSLSFPSIARCLTMESVNYKILTEVVSVGGETSTSTNYQVFNTVGEFGVTETNSTSTNYNLASGFQPSSSAGATLSATLSTNSISLGELTTSDVSSASQILTVTTNAATGYTTTIKSDGQLRSGSNTIPDIAVDGTVTSGVASYGISTAGGAGQMNSSTTSTPLSTSDQILAATSTPATGEQTTITYKAAIGSDTAYGTYSQSVTFTTTVNY